MKRNLSSVSKKNKKQRGVAVIFTLGILGLLTVMALGFASTALLNNSLSKNVMNIAYARGLAKNLALTQAMYIIRDKEIRSNGGLVDYRNVYSWGTDTNSVNHKDFLWKLDYTEAGDSGVQIYKYEPDQTTANPANNVRWQYVKDTSSPTPKIIGRYAYVVIPNRGRIDPSVNIGRLASAPDTDSTYSIPSITSDADLKKLESIISPISSTNSCYLAMKNNFRWMTFRELAKKAAISETAYMFDCNGISPSLAMKSPEAFRKDGKLYSRFNMNRTAEWWNSVTPSDLCGVGKTLAEFPNEQTFIPWLKDMYNKSSDLQAKALQIAANIIQYNRAADQPTVTNKESDADWLTNTPAYAGIGRHPMLNEIGFLVRVSVHVETAPEADPDENHIRVKYTPVYRITIDTGAELIDPFGIPSLQNSIIQFSGTEDTDNKYTWKYPDSPAGKDKDTSLSAEKKKIKNMLMKFTLNKFQKNADGGKDPQTVVNDLADHSKKLIEDDGRINAEMLHPTHIDRIIIETTGKYGKTVDSSTVLSEEGSGASWTDFDLSLASGDWNTSPAYTKAASFWKGRSQRILKIPIRSFTITTAKSIGTKEDIAKALARRMTVTFEDFTPGNVVLKYGPAESEKQRDIAMLTKKTSPHTPFSFTMTDMEMGDGKEYVKFIAYEANDPLFNHSYESWKIAQSDLRSWTGGYNDYPGTLYDGTADKHVNKPFSDIFDAADSDPVKILLTSYGYKKATGAPVPDPAYVTDTSRLPASFIRHGPMRSFWELGCISRGDKFETLNLMKKDNSASADLDFSYAKGDGILFDQLKFTDENYSAGKINLNTDVHRVLEKVFNNSLIGYKENLNKASGDVLPDAGTAPSDNPIDNGEITINTTTGKSVMHSTPSAAECIACQLINATGAYALKNRGDLLTEQTKLPVGTGETTPTSTNWDTLQSLLLNGDTYLEKIQILSKLMPVLRTDPVDTLYVVIVAQSIRDIGGNIPVLVDWDGTGIDTAVPSTDNAEKKKAMFKAGFRRTINGTAISGLSEPTLSKTYTANSIGTYDLGSDKITGETRLVATLVRDPVKRKWKLVRLQYVE